MGLLNESLEPYTKEEMLRGIERLEKAWLEKPFLSPKDYTITGNSITIDRGALVALRDYYRKQHEKMIFRAQEGRDNKGKADLLDDILKLF